MDLTGVIDRRATDRTVRNATSRPAGACRVRLARLEPGPEGPGQALAPARRPPAEVVHVVDRRAPGPRTDVGDLRVLADPAELHRRSGHEQAPVELDPD